jgi:hypothetical protein
MSMPMTPYFFGDIMPDIMRPSFKDARACHNVKTVTRRVLDNIISNREDFVVHITNSIGP